jgi:hypothetical protein
MKEYRYKQIDKSLPIKFSNIVFSIVGNIKKQGFNKYNFKDIREKIYLEAESLYEENVSEETFIKKLNQTAEKCLTKAIKKRPLENASGVLFIIFAIITLALPIVYLMNFNSTFEKNPFVSEGLNISMQMGNLSNLVSYFCIGVLFAILIQKMDKRAKWIILGSLTIAFILLVSFLQAFASLDPERIISINFVLCELISLVLTIGFYYAEDYLAKKSYSSKVR